MTLGELRTQHFQGHRFREDHLRQAGKILKKDGEDAAIAFLREKMGAKQANFKPPAKCLIVAVSKPFSEWPIVKASEAIQRYVYGLSVEERAACKPGTSKESHAAWFASTNVDTAGYRSVQGLNLIFEHALKRYDGVLKKVENRNKKRKARIDAINEKRREKGEEEIDLSEEMEKATNDTGHLLQPPGINPSIYAYQGARLRPFNGDVGLLPETYAGYDRDPDAPLPMIGKRIDIRMGCAGYVPEHQRDKLTQNKHRRVRHHWADEAEKARNALLVWLTFGPDCWVVIDARGLLRNARWRKVAPKDVSLNGLLNLYTGDPVITPPKDCSVRQDTAGSPAVAVATFTYKADVIGIQTKPTTIKTKRTRDVLLSLTQPDADGLSPRIGLVAVDLGQTNFAAASMFRVHQTVGTKGEPDLVADPVEKFFLPDDVIAKFLAYRRRYDELETTLRAKALASLTAEHQAEIRRIDTAPAETTKARLCANMGLDPASLPWGEMTSNTTYISDALLALGCPEDDVFFISRPKNKPPKREKQKDRGWAAKWRERLSTETRKAFNDALWEMKRIAPEYEKLSKWKEELARHAANLIVQKTLSRTQCKTVIPVIEDLNVRFLHGNGKRDGGWDNFFVPKRENRWFMQALHKALTELGTHKGMYVMEVCPAWTSRTCPDCRHCDHDNRDGERFVCRKCGATYHADLDVATYNIAQVALTGKALPRPPESEQSDGEKKPGTARKRKSKKSDRNPAMATGEIAQEASPS